MLQFFLNPWLLTGAAGIALPVIAHLLSRRRYDVVPWAAMQFLNPARKTRRRLRLEELLLLLIRIGLVLLLVSAVARPWIPAGWLSGFQSSGSRTVVIVVDGSNSMARSDGLNSLHQTAVRRVRDFLQTLSPGDSTALIDARDLPRAVVESPLQDQSLILEALDTLPPPAGAGDLQAAIERATGILSRSSSASREIVIFTDRHRAGWQPDDSAAWKRIDELLGFPAVKPRIWTMDVGRHLTPLTQNIAIGQIELSREFTVPDFPLRLRTTVSSASKAEVQIPVRLLADGQPLASQQKSITVPAGGSATVEFEHSFRVEGTHTLTVEALTSTDAISTDNQAHVAVHVKSALPVLLVNGKSTVSNIAKATFFAQIAFESGGRMSPWVASREVEAQAFAPADLQNVAVVALVDVGELPDGMLSAVRDFVKTGGGLIVVCGEQTTPEFFRRLAVDQQILPGVELLRPREAAVAGAGGMQVAQLSLQSGWLERFRSDPSRSFLKTQYHQWWQTKVSEANPNTTQPLPEANVDPQRTEPAQPTKQNAAAVQDLTLDLNGESLEDSIPGQPVVMAQLTAGDPLLIQGRLGQGTVFVFTSTWNRDWNDFATRSDFVPFLHEIVFQSAASRVKRNLEFGAPIIAEVGDGDTFQMRLPSGEPSDPIVPQVSGRIPIAFFDQTWQPGVFRLEQPREGSDPVTEDLFVVNYDHAEDNMEELNANDLAKLSTDERVRFAGGLDELSQAMYGDEARMELWAMLLWSFLALLLLEVWLTRRIVMRGYGSTSPSSAGNVSPVSASL